MKSEHTFAAMVLGALGADLALQTDVLVNFWLAPVSTASDAVAVTVSALSMSPLQLPFLVLAPVVTLFALTRYLDKNGVSER